MSQIGKSEEEWKAELSMEAYNVLRNKATERPCTGTYNDFFPDKGHFACAGCEAPLYSYKDKFDSGSGWPAFHQCLKDALNYHPEPDGRIAIRCKCCGGHLGFIFLGENFNQANERHCVNSVAIRYMEAERQ